MLASTETIESTDKTVSVTAAVASKARHSRMPMVPILEGMLLVRTQMPASEVAKIPLMFAWGKELTLDGCRVGVEV